MGWPGRHGLHHPHAQTSCIRVAQMAFPIWHVSSYNNNGEHRAHQINDMARARQCAGSGRALVVWRHTALWSIRFFMMCRRAKIAHCLVNR